MYIFRVEQIEKIVSQKYSVHTLGKECMKEEDMWKGGQLQEAHFGD
jgi:hypothetical protein